MVYVVGDGRFSLSRFTTFKEAAVRAREIYEHTGIVVAVELEREPMDELETLRLSVRRLAEQANRDGAELVIPATGNERGWNRLVAGLMDYWEEVSQQNRSYKRRDR